MWQEITCRGKIQGIHVMCFTGLGSDGADLCHDSSGYVQLTLCNNAFIGPQTSDSCRATCFNHLLQVCSHCCQPDPTRRLDTETFLLQEKSFLKDKNFFPGHFILEKYSSFAAILTCDVVAAQTHSISQRADICLSTTCRSFNGSPSSCCRSPSPKREPKPIICLFLGKTQSGPVTVSWLI